MDALLVTAAFERYFPIIQAKCARVLSDPQEAEDVAQETFIRLWQSALVGQAPEQVSAWIYRTCTRVAIDRLRQRGRQRVLLQRAAAHAAVVTGQGGAEAVGPAAPATIGEDVLAARRLLHKLASQIPEEELEVVILSRLDLLTHAEIAEVVLCSERTVRRLLQRFDQRVQGLPAELRP